MIDLSKNMVGIETSVNGNFDMDLFPNPFQNVIQVNIDPLANQFEEVDFSVFGLNGNLVFRKLLESSETQIDLSAIPQGIYFAKVQVNGAFKAYKIVKR